jgi:hypothetical protein
MAGRPKEGLGNGVRSASALPSPVAGKGKRAAKEGERSREMRGGEPLCYGIFRNIQFQYDTHLDLHAVFGRLPPSPRTQFWDVERLSEERD